MNTIQLAMPEKKNFDYQQLTLRRATVKDGETVKKLRLDAYAKSVTLSLIDHSVMHWTALDDQNMVLLVENENGDPVATLKGYKVWNEREFNQVSNTVCPPDLTFPLLYLSTGCTHKNYQKKGMNTLLKLFFIRFLIDSDVPQLVQTITTGTKRIKMLEKLGFEFRDIPPVETAIVINSQLLLGTLDREDFRKALPSATANLQSAFHQISIDPLLEQQMQEYLGQGPSVYKPKRRITRIRSTLNQELVSA